MYVYIYICFIYIYFHRYTHVCVCADVHLPACTEYCIHMCMYIYIYIYIHACTRVFFSHLRISFGMWNFLEPPQWWGGGWHPLPRATSWNPMNRQDWAAGVSPRKNRNARGGVSQHDGGKSENKPIFLMSWLKKITSWDWDNFCLLCTSRTRTRRRQKFQR